jgi:hypothetical protein
MQSEKTHVPLIFLAAALATLSLATIGRAADAAASNSGSPDAGPHELSIWTKAKWLSDLSFTVKESFDDNVLGVSGLGMPTETSWVNSISVKMGMNLIPLMETPKDFTALSLTYNPESVIYDNAPAEDYIAHRVSGVIKARADNVTFSLEDAFLYNDGNKVAPTYAENQLAGAAGNQSDKYRNNFAHSVARERRNQIQDRYTAFVQFDEGDLFVRPISQLTEFNLNTQLFNTTLAPYKGYQDYIDRYDINGGADLGYKLTKDLAVTVGYRDGFQHQDQFALAINSDRHFASNHYQRLLFGLEGKLTSWLTAKLAAGPDFRDYNPDTAISDLHTTRYYGEGSLVAAFGSNQTLTLSYKQWEFVSSTGLVPYGDTAASLVYHWSVTKEVGIDVGIKYLEASYTIGDDYSGSAPSLRDDVDYGGSVSFTYAVTKKFVLSVAYSVDDGRNNMDRLPANFYPGYRDFTHSVTTLGVTYKL